MTVGLVGQELGTTGKGITCKQERTSEREKTLKSASNMVGLGKVNGGNKDHGSELGMRRDGDAPFA